VTLPSKEIKYYSPGAKFSLSKGGGSCTTFPPRQAALSQEERNGPAKMVAYEGVDVSCDLGMERVVAGFASKATYADGTSHEKNMNLVVIVEEAQSRIDVYCKP
jgi:hypothetical protein